jgi:preprotein translocase subunit SecE
MINKAKQFLDDVQKELKKVSWPGRDQLISATFVVIVISALFTVFIYLTDLAVSTIVQFLYTN